MNTPKHHRLVQAVICAVAASTTPVSAILINFGSDYPLNVIDSQGATITDAMGYVFQLGAFANGFTPNSGNKSLWDDNWVVFTELGYFQPLIIDDPLETGYWLTGSATLMPDKLPGNVVIPNEPLTNPGRDPSDLGGYSDWYSVHNESLVAGSTYDFSGEKAYLWIFDSNDPSNARVEQFLASSSSWIFPDKFVESAGLCCDNRTPLNWAVSDINETPLVGEFPPGPPETIQTIPEASPAMLGLIGALSLIGRRRR